MSGLSFIVAASFLGLFFLLILARKVMVCSGKSHEG